MPSKALRVGLATAAAAVLAAGAVVWVSGDEPATTAETVTAPVWGTCPDPAATDRMQCARITVPLDYRVPHGRRIEIAISRLPSAHPDKRRGVLFTNPGGPGGAGLSYPALLAAAKLPQSVLDAYDVIGMDPRGVGESTPVTCGLSETQRQRRNLPAYAHTDADVVAEAEFARAIADQCATSDSAWLLPHTTTANTARDIDRIRAALGEDKISYLGHSYGTALGAVYATMFPERGDRIVLDSALGPGGYDHTAFRRLARGVQERFPDFAAYAAAHPEYGLGSTPEEITAEFDDLAARLDANPIGGIDGTRFRGMTIDYLFSDAALPALAASWRALDSGQPAPEAPPPGDVDNLISSRHAVLCADSRWPRDIGYYQHSAAVDRERYPLVGGSTGNIVPCAYWPDLPSEPWVPITDQGPSNVLLLQNERDPGTPLIGAREMRESLGGRARMVTVDQGGHGVYPFGANTCADDIATGFLTAGTRPDQDTHCPANR
ncbi:alpha/beta hydrolase [Nocardia otitidiscaviarum]|uniref:alpha/beta hydrolase n=1 Tax=Nocardia otitidiscaviarum TaxID=1823 RepID=UPI0018949A53|nr:alpha/beta hydrolase [Nocardia otitidiscaviarum]MBF6180775.1 alpha/beta fold hydrolase [Nocardia otitidiscaviarum]